jgi:putative ABC transport system permease protein
MLSKLVTRIRALLHKSKMERELDEEMRHHIERQTEQNVRLGMNPEEARYAARKAFGGVEQAKERSRDARGVRWIEELWQDLRYGARMLLKHPGFTLIAVITLALGIGANTAIFSVVNAVLLKSLPYDEPDRLVFVGGYGEGNISYPNFADWRSQNQVFEKIGAFNYGDYNLTGDGESERLRAAQISADLFGALRASAALGRVFTNDEDRPGASPVVVLSHGLWRRRFGGATNIIGRTLTLNDRGYTVVGVMPQGFSFPARAEMWVPVGPLSAQEIWKLRNAYELAGAVARLKPGATIEQARANMKNITAALEKEYPDTNHGGGAMVIPLLEKYVKDIRRTLYVLLGAVGFVLLIACANIASLTLARAAARQKEMTLRTALGANRWRIARQLLTETLMLALGGGALGLLIAYWGVMSILAICPEGAIPRLTEINIDRNVLLFTAAVSILTGVVFGLAPASRLSRPDAQRALKEMTRNATSRQGWLRSGLVVTEIALTLVLLVGAGLLIRSFLRLQQVNPGFATENTLRFKISLMGGKDPDTELNSHVNFFNQVREKIAALPGVQSVGLSSGLPLGHNRAGMNFTIVSQPDPPPAATPFMETCVADINYFETLRIPLVRGRFFGEQDNRSHVKPEDLKGKTMLQQRIAGMNAIIIDEEFARRYFPGEDPIGRQIRLGRSSNPLASLPLTIVGVVGRVKMEGLRWNADIVQGYLPFRQAATSSMIFTVRAQLPPEQLIASVRRQVQEVDPNQPIYDIGTLEETRAEAIAPERFNLTLLGVFAAVAFTLALVGIYGVVSWTVTQRTQEIGVRMALGAQAGDVLRFVVRQGMKIVAAGVALGMAGAYGLTRLMKALLFEVSAADPITFISIGLLLAGTALLACFIPARRATKVDPMVALRAE